MHGYIWVRRKENKKVNIFQTIFSNAFSILIEISDFIPKGSTDNKSELVQVIAWGLFSDNPLAQPILHQIYKDVIQTHQWFSMEIRWSFWKPFQVKFNSLRPSDAYMRQ